MTSEQNRLVVQGYIRLQSKPHYIPNVIIELCLLWFVPIQIMRHQFKGGSFKLFEYLTVMTPTKMLQCTSYNINEIRVKHNQSDNKFILKQFHHYNHEHLSRINLIYTEIKLLSQFKHRNVMYLIDAIPLKKDEIDTFNKIHILLPNMDTTLKTAIRSKQLLTERHKQYFIYQIMRGLQYIHKCGVIHAHLEPSNILINYNDCHIKITGFRYAVPVNTINYARILNTRYIAPELIAGDYVMTEKTDIWAVGCIAAELYKRRPLFTGRSLTESFQLILQYIGTPTDMSWINSGYRKWVKRQPVQQGMDLNELLPSSTKMAGDFIRKLLILDPKQRIDVETAMNHEWLKRLEKLDKTRKKEMNDCSELRLNEIQRMKPKEIRQSIYKLINGIYQIAPRKYSNAL